MKRNPFCVHSVLKGMLKILVRTGIFLISFTLVHNHSFAQPETVTQFHSNDEFQNNMVAAEGTAAAAQSGNEISPALQEQMKIISQMQLVYPVIKTLISLFVLATFQAMAAKCGPTSYSIATTAMAATALASLVWRIQNFIEDYNKTNDALDSMKRRLLANKVYYKNLAVIIGNNNCSNLEDSLAQQNAAINGDASLCQGRVGTMAIFESVTPRSILGKEFDKYNLASGFDFNHFLVDQKAYYKLSRNFLEISKEYLTNEINNDMMCAAMDSFDLVLAIGEAWVVTNGLCGIKDVPK